MIGLGLCPHGLFAPKMWWPAWSFDSEIALDGWSLLGRVAPTIALAWISLISLTIWLIGDRRGGCPATSSRLTCAARIALAVATLATTTRLLLIDFPRLGSLNIDWFNAPISHVARFRDRVLGGFRVTVHIRSRGISREEKSYFYKIVVPRRVGSIPGRVLGFLVADGVGVFWWDLFDGRWIQNNAFVALLSWCRAHLWFAEPRIMLWTFVLAWLGDRLGKRLFSSAIINDAEKRPLNLVLFFFAPFARMALAPFPLRLSGDV